jgi:hypothetical protein
LTCGVGLKPIPPTLFQRIFNRFPVSQANRLNCRARRAAMRAAMRAAGGDAAWMFPKGIRLNRWGVGVKRRGVESVRCWLWQACF